VLSIQVLNVLNPLIQTGFLFLILALGPFIGLYYFRKGMPA
jgi:hypothetical protein